MLENGYIRLHRSILSWGWYSDTNVFRLFLHLLLTANFKPKEWRGLVIERGQLVTSTAKLAEQTGLSIKACRVALDKLKKTGEVASEGHSQYTVITVLKYDLYQSEGQANGEPTASEGQAEGKQGASEGQQLKKEKKEKKEIKQEVYAPPLPENAEMMFSPGLLEAVAAWLTYKHERKEDYKPTGLQSLLTQIQNKAGEFGDAAVCEVIRLSMSNNWRGIVWDRLEKKGAPGPGTPPDQPKQLAAWEKEWLERVKRQIAERKAAGDG